MKKVAFLVLILLAFFYISIGEDDLTVAACPTFHYLLDDFDNYVKTNSTAESISLFLNGEVDAFISGRALKPSEPDIPFEVIGSGYSFLYQVGGAILEREMNHYQFYTDLEGVSEDFPYIEKIEKVEDVYEYIDKGIVITSVINTDYSKGEVVSVFQDNGERVRLSRTPVMYSYDLP